MNWKGYTLGFVCVVSVWVIGGYGVGFGAAQQQGTPSSYAVIQDRTCFEIEPLGDGTQSVDRFYDYRSGPNASYSSAGTRGFQVSQASQLFVYEGRNGVSLVFLHDRLDDGGRGGAASFDISGLPATGTWVVEDDGPAADDRFQHAATTSTIDWMWGPGRTDGAAFRGLNGVSFRITVEPAWGENAWAATGRTPTFPYADDETTRWFVRGADGTRDLDRDAPVAIEPGDCDRAGPATTLASTPNATVTGEDVRLDASGTTDASPIVAYRWDTDGDGTVDRTTSEPNLTVSFDGAGVYRPAVTAVDRFRNTDSANVTVNVTARSPSGANEDAPAAVRAGLERLFSAAAAIDTTGIVRSRWDFGDGTTVGGGGSEAGRSGAVRRGGGSDGSGGVGSTAGAGDAVGSGAPAGVRGGEDGDGGSFGRQIAVESSTQQRLGMRLSLTRLGPNRFVATVRNATINGTVAGETPGDVGEAGNDAELRAIQFTATANRALYRLNVTVSGSSGADAGATRVDEELVALFPEIDPETDIDANTFEVTYVFDVDRSRLAELNVSQSNIVVATRENGEWRHREPATRPSGSELVVNVTTNSPAPVLFGLQRPNLSVTNVSFGSRRVVRGRPTNVTIRLYNDGHRDASERIRLRSGNRTYVDRTVAVPARSRRNLSARVRFTRLGDRSLTALEYSRPLEVVPPRPDMVVTDVRLERETIRPGENATIHATVRNRGSAAGTARVDVSAFGTVVSRERIDLAPDGVGNVSYSQRIDSPGTYELGVNGTTRQVVVRNEGGGNGAPADAESGPSGSGGVFSQSLVAVLVGLALSVLAVVIVAATVWE